MRKNRHAVLAAAAMAALLGNVAQAATLNWDADGVAPVDGGSGTWNTTSALWEDGLGGYTTWNNLTPDNAVIGVWSGASGGPGGTLTLGEAITAGTVRFDADNYTINLAGNNFTTTGALSYFFNAGPPEQAVTSNTITITDTSAPGSAATYTIGNASGYPGIKLSGNMNVTYTGTGIWVAGGANDFTGTLRLLSGTTRPELNSGLGSADGLVQLDATAQLTFNAPSGQVYNTFTRDIELIGTTQRMAASGAKNITLTGSISGSGDLNQNATQGQLILAGDNSYTGATIISGQGAALVLAHDNALGLSPTIGPSGTVASTIGIKGGVHVGQNANLVTPTMTLGNAQPANGYGHLYSFDGDNVFDGNITPSSNIARVYNVASNSTLTLNGVINGDAVAQSGSGVLKIGDGALILTGANDYGQRNATTSNETEIRAGTLRLDFNGPHSPLVDIVNNGNLTNGNQVTYLVLAGGTLELKGKADVSNSQRFKNSSAANSFRIRPGESAIRLNQNGATDLTLNTGRLMPANREVGGTVDFTLPAAGGVVLGTSVAGAVGVPDEILLASGAAFATVDGTDWAAMNATRNVVSGSTIAGFYTDNSATAVSGNANIVATDTTLAGADALTTSVRFNEAAARTIDATGQALTTGGILVTGNVGNNVTTIAGGTLRGADSALGTLQDLVVVQNNTAGRTVISSNITDAANAAATGLTKSGAGTLELSGTNTYTGVTHVNNGVLKLGSAGALPGGVDAAVGVGESGLVIKGGVVGLTSDFGRALTGTTSGSGVTLAAPGQVRWNASGGFAAYGGDRTVAIPVSDVDPTLRTLHWGASGGSSTIIGFVPSAANLILGADDADATLIFANNIALGNGNVMGWQVERTIDVRNGSAAVDARMTGVISAEYGVEKIGAGTLELAEANTYGGGTTINGGTLLVGNVAGSGTGPGFVNVNNGTLGGTGTITGPVTVASDGAVAPGTAGIGTLTLSRLTLASGSELNFDLAAPGGTSDLLNVTANGGLTLDGGSVALSDAGGLAEGSYTLIDYDTAFNGLLENLGTTGPAGFNYALANDETNTAINLIVSAIPTGASVWDKDDSDSLWSASSSWVGGVPNAIGATATFGSKITAAQTVNVDGIQTVGTINFDNPNSYTVAPATDGAIVIDALTEGAVNVAAGSHAISAPLTLNKNATFTVTPADSTLTVSSFNANGQNLTKAGAGKLTVNRVRANALNVTAGTVQMIADQSAAGVSRVATLNIAPEARVDLGQNKLITDTVGTWDGTKYTGLQGEVGRAYNFGAWDLPGLMTSDEQAGPNVGRATIGVATGQQALFLAADETGLFAGETISGTTAIAMYTWAGDVDLNGYVDAVDYGTIDNWIQFPGTTGYTNGDLNYDGVIDAVDYGIIDNGIQLQGDPIPVNGVATASASLSGVTAVPEPSACGFAFLAAASLLGRRRRRCCK